jgi:hypothetical protein
VKAILREYRICRVTAEQVLEQIRQPALRLAPCLQMALNNAALRKSGFLMPSDLAAMNR